EELDRVLDGALQAPLSEADHDKLKDALHALAEMLVRPRNTEKTSEVVEKPEGSETGQQPDDNTPPPPGHGRNGAEAFGGARKVDIRHQNLTHGDRCPECGKGKPACRREHRRGVETAERGAAESDSNVRRVVAQRFAVACGRRNPAGQLSRSWPQAVRGRGGELPQRMPLRARDAGSGVWPRR